MISTAPYPWRPARARSVADITGSETLAEVRAFKQGQKQTAEAAIAAGAAKQ